MGGRLPLCCRAARRPDAGRPGNASGNPDLKLGKPHVHFLRRRIHRRLRHGRDPGGAGGRREPAAVARQQRSSGNLGRVRPHPHEPGERTRFLLRRRRLGPRMAGDAVSRLERGWPAGRGRLAAHGAGSPGVRRGSVPRGAGSHPGRCQRGRERHPHRDRDEPVQLRCEQLRAGSARRLGERGGHHRSHQTGRPTDGGRGRRAHLQSRLRRHGQRHGFQRYARGHYPCGRVLRRRIAALEWHAPDRRHRRRCGLLRRRGERARRRDRGVRGGRHGGNGDVPGQGRFRSGAHGDQPRRRDLRVVGNLRHGVLQRRADERPRPGAHPDQGARGSDPGRRSDSRSNTRCATATPPVPPQCPTSS